MIVGCYTLHLYCDNENCPGNEYAHPSEPNYLPKPADFAAETGPQCIRIARRHGWKITRDDQAFCPLCSGKKKRGSK